MASPAVRVDPYRGFNFRVEIDGTSVAAFSEVTGLTADGDSVDYRNGNDSDNHVRKLVGLRKFHTPITLKRGYTKDSTFWDWYSAVATGASNARRNFVIVLCDETQTDVLYFLCSNGFLNKVEGPHMSAAGNEVAIESAEIIAESISIKLAS